MDQVFTVNVNGQSRQVTCSPETPLLWVLRGELELTGTKYGCGSGLCGSCTVHIDGVARHACDTPLWSVGDSYVVTIEGLRYRGQEHPVQREIINSQAMQCGYCISGIIMRSAQRLNEAQVSANTLDREAICRAIEGHLCRCGAHNRMIEAIAKANISMNSDPSEDS